MRRYLKINLNLMNTRTRLVSTVALFVTAPSSPKKTHHVMCNSQSINIEIEMMFQILILKNIKKRDKCMYIDINKYNKQKYR